jgi:hypothetical protein
MYAEGDGIPQVAQALKWFILAAAPNHKDAIENRDQAILLITPRSNRRSAKARTRMEAYAAANADSAMNRLKTVPIKCPLLGLNRTPRVHRGIDAHDPERPLGRSVCGRLLAFLPASPSQSARF